MATLTAVNPTTGNQVTQYVYGTTLATSAIARNDLLAAEIYPDSADSADQVSYTYNRQGQVVTKTDQNGTVRTYSYDLLGRPLADAVTALGTGIDGAVGQIAWLYAVQGQVRTISSYYSPSGGSSIVNEVQFNYNPSGQVVAEYQEHTGGVTGVTPSVGYHYADGSAGTIRPTGVVYPNGRTLHYGYNAGLDDALNRVSFLASSPLPPGEGQGEGSDQTLAEYSYLGAGAIVRVTYPEPCLRGGVYRGGADPYAGLDQFGRVVDLLWRNCTTVQDVVRIGHGYDRAGNRLWRSDSVARANSKNFDELYAYDGVNQLISLQRGSLNAAQTGLVSTANFAQQWTLDATGNWTQFRENDTGTGTWSLNQTRTHDPANEILSFAESPGATWAQPVYDSVGNMTSVPQPASPTASCTCTYDAWNRLVKVVDASTGNIVVTYAYDGRGFRVLRDGYTGGDLLERRHYYFNSSWQVLEERIEQAPIPNPQSLIPVSQYVWGLRYIDDLVLRDRQPTGSSSLSERFYALQDPNWNVVAIADPTGAIRERYQYTAYGVRSVLSPAFALSGDGTNYDWSYAVTGRPLDSATRSMDYRARIYDPPAGAWTSRDPISADINLYRYCGNNPAVRFDPNGLEWLTTPDDFGEGRRRVCNSSANDRVSAIASTLNLTPREFREWLVPVDNAQLPASENQPVGVVGQKFSIPNTVVEYKMVSASVVTTPAIQVCRIAASLTAADFSIRGYKLVQVSDGTYASFRDNFRDRDTAVFCFGGHGTVDSLNKTKSLTLTDGWLEPLITVHPYQVHRPFGLAFLGLYACYSANDAGPGNGYWSQFVSTTGRFEGGNGLVYAWSTFVAWTGPTPPAGM